MSQIQSLQSLEHWRELAKSTTQLIVIDYYTDRCGPCKALAPQLQKMAAENTDVVFVKVNLDDHPDFTKQHNITAVPTVNFVKDGKMLHTITGNNYSGIVAAIKQYK